MLSHLESEMCLACQALAPAMGSAAAKLMKALELCRLWTESDLEIYKDAPFTKNLNHRLHVIETAIAEAVGESPNNDSATNG